MIDSLIGVIQNMQEYFTRRTREREREGGGRDIAYVIYNKNELVQPNKDNIVF